MQLVFAIIAGRIEPPMQLLFASIFALMVIGLSVAMFFEMTHHYRERRKAERRWKRLRQQRRELAERQAGLWN